jgi:hypothetical protein
MLTLTQNNQFPRGENGRKLNKFSDGIAKIYTLHVLKIVLACCIVLEMVVIVREFSKSPMKKFCRPTKVIVRGSHGKIRKLLSLKVPGMSVSIMTCGATPFDASCMESPKHSVKHRTGGFRMFES